METVAGETEIRWLSPEEQDAWRGLLRMQAKLSVALSRDLAEHGELSLQDYGVLVVLTDRPDGRLRAYELGEELGWEKSRLSHHVARMARRGLVTRQRCPSDQRGLYVAVTDRGRTALRMAAPGHVETVRRVFIDSLSPSQLAALADVSRAVLDDTDDTDSATNTDVTGTAATYSATATGTDAATGTGTADTATAGTAVTGTAGAVHAGGGLSAPGPAPRARGGRGGPTRRDRRRASPPEGRS